jgi:hypothetical protein
MKVIKVCKEVNGKWISRQVWDFPLLVKTYELNRTTKPDVGLLFAFSNIEYAKEWIEPGDDVVYLHCEGIEKKKLIEGDEEFCAPDDVPFSRNNQKSVPLIEKWWKWFLNKNGIPKSIEKFISGWSCPKGTILCSEITPIRVIKVKRIK